MAFIPVGSLIAGAVEVAPPKDVYEFELHTADTAVVRGTVMKGAAAGRMTPVSAQDNLAVVVALEDVDAPSGGARAKFRGMWIAPGQLFKVPAGAGTAASALVGATYRYHSTGTKFDQENAHQTSEPVICLKVTTDYIICTLSTLFAAV